MAYDPNKPITASNCPTRDALEKDFTSGKHLKQSIGARHSPEKTARHKQNVMNRQLGKKK